MTRQMEMAFLLAEEGAERAANHAEREIDGWKEGAFELVRIFCGANAGAEFTMADIRLANPGFPDAPDNRAWGHVALRAFREGLVAKAGYTRIQSAHARVQTLWRVIALP